MTLYVLYGASIAGFAISGLFFLRFWYRTGDNLFLFFCVAFWLLCLNQAFVAFNDIPAEEASWVYLLRLAAFLIIILAIVMKNAQSTKGK
jgi:hypothetical protein